MCALGTGGGSGHGSRQRVRLRPPEGLTQQQAPLSCQQAGWGGGGGFCGELFGAEGVANGNV